MLSNAGNKECKLFANTFTIDNFIRPHATDACILRANDLSILNKSPKLKDELHLRRNSYVTLDMAMNVLKLGLFKT